MRPFAARPRDSRLRIVVAGFMVRGPVGGMVWCSLHFVLGLRRLGHDVLFLEDSTDSPWCCYDPERGVTDHDPTHGLQYAHDAFRREGFGDAWAYWDAHGSSWLGPRARDAVSFCREADVLLNISGISPLRDWTAAIPCRVFVDTDPGFTQIKHTQDAEAAALARAHTRFFTYGENFGKPGCLIPDDGLPWWPMRQPIVLDRWPVVPVRENAPFTTVMLWNSYQAREFAGRRFGMKSDAFGPYLNLPRRTDAPLELALGGPDAPRHALRTAGWRIVNPLEVARTPGDYRNYIQASAGEFGLAKHGYVLAQSGAFSDRTAAYLASGRPAIVLDTGFRDLLPVGDGLCAFSDADEAISALESVRRDPARHQRAARQVAEEYFDSDTILRNLLDRALASPSSPLSRRAAGDRRGGRSPARQTHPR